MESITGLKLDRWPTVNDPLKLAILDTGQMLDRYIVWAYRVPGVDSLYFETRDGNIFSLKDSIGSGGGSGSGTGDSIISYSKNATLDSAILLLKDGRRFAVKDSVGSGGSATDTTSLSNRINLKLNISDTSTMLSNYLRNVCLLMLLMLGCSQCRLLQCCIRLYSYMME